MSNSTVSFSPTILTADFPAACASIQVSVFQSLDNACFTSCLPFGSNSKPLDIFSIPTDASNCGEFEEELCVYTSCCMGARGQLNRLYRCILRNIDTSAVPYLNGVEITDDLSYYANSCPLSCSADNYAIVAPGDLSSQVTAPTSTSTGTSPTAAPTVAAVAAQPTMMVPEPTASATAQPTTAATPAPTAAATSQPTVAATPVPTAAATASPTTAATTIAPEPTAILSAELTLGPEPTAAAAVQTTTGPEPTLAPTTGTPTDLPSLMPSTEPSGTPVQGTAQPTVASQTIATNNALPPTLAPASSIVSSRPTMGAQSSTPARDVETALNADALMSQEFASDASPKYTHKGTWYRAVTWTAMVGAVVTLAAEVVVNMSM